MNAPRTSSFRPTTSADLPPALRAGVLGVLRCHPQVRHALLFGSLARGRARMDSDLDLAVAGDGPLPASALTALTAELAEVTLRLTRAVQLCVGIAAPILALGDAGPAPQTMGDAFDRLGGIRRNRCGAGHPPARRLFAMSPSTVTARQVFVQFARQ
ncbi:MAG: nucleotidyltransferase domain-containing protein [Gammaproteobacteria bacterium]|nr:nucleotidyltransferase domain-containing protein [Gammaproteobacteria bacterium]